jgi:threonine dehydrogenase-like Zn-dependent dehydrogenase
MKTLICTKPGLFDYAEREMPQSKKINTIIRIRRIGICGTDLHAFEGTQPYFQYPRVLGHELAALIEETGEGVTFQRDDPLLSFLISIVVIVSHVVNGKTNCVCLA